MSNTTASTIRGSLWPVAGIAPAQAHIQGGIGLYRYALVDHAGAKGLLPILRAGPNLRWQSLFKGSQEESALAVAPILIDMGATPQAPSHHALLVADWLQRSCPFSHAVLTLHSPFEFEAVATGLANRMQALLTPNMEILLRYFDARIFASLIDVLDKEQAGTFFGIASQWAWLDRTGQLQTLETTTGQADAFVAPLPLTQAQEDALLERAHPDAVVQQMTKSDPNLCHAHANHELHALVSQCLPLMRGYGINSLQEQALFSLTELQQGPKFYEQAAWQQALHQAQRDKVAFTHLISQMAASS